MNVRFQRGQGTIEFQIISVLVLIPLLMGVIQIGLLVVSKNTLNVAALAAARAGAESGGDRAAMQAALDVGLAPLHANAAKLALGVGMNDLTGGLGGTYGTVMGSAAGLSKALNVLYSEINVHNPTVQSFNDFGVKTKLGTIIPVTNVYDNAAVGGQSRQTRAESLLLKIEVNYCEELVIPVIDKIIQATMTPGLSPQAVACYAKGRVQLTSQAIVRMTVAPIREKLL